MAATAGNGEFYRYPWAMIDRSALEQVAGRHLASMQSPSGVSLIVHLHGGSRYTVHGFEEFLDAYCVVRVYPADDELKDEVPRDPSGAGIFDRLILPYQGIHYVTITAREPENRSTIGFHT
jgi:hypothetical protein